MLRCMKIDNECNMENKLASILTRSTTKLPLSVSPLAIHFNFQNMTAKSCLDTVTYILIFPDLPCKEIISMIIFQRQVISTWLLNKQTNSTQLFMYLICILHFFLNLGFKAANKIKIDTGRGLRLTFLKFRLVQSSVCKAWTRTVNEKTFSEAINL